MRFVNEVKINELSCNSFPISENGFVWVLHVKSRRVQEAYRKKGIFSNRFWREANKNMLIKPPFLFKGRTVLHKKLVYNFLSTSLYIIFFSWPVPRMIAPAGGPYFCLLFVKLHTDEVGPKIATQLIMQKGLP